MSYTHYWTTKKLDKAATKEVLEDALDFVKELSWHSGIRIGDGLGEGKPKIEHGFLAFNGYGEEDSYESFCLEPNGTSTFCKTAHRPYDTICVAMLVWAWKQNLLTDLNSDGNIFDWLAGIKAYNKAAGDFTPEDYKKLAKILTHASEPNTEVLSTTGWKHYFELERGDEIYAWKDGNLEVARVNKVVVNPFKGKLPSYKGNRYH